MSQSFDPHATTILAVRRKGAIALGGDGPGDAGQYGHEGQCPQGAAVSPTARWWRICRRHGGLRSRCSKRFEGKLEKFGNLTRAAIETGPRTGVRTGTCAGSRRLAAGRRSDSLFVISGNGDVIEPEHELAAIVRGPYAQAAALACCRTRKLARARSSRRRQYRRRHLHLHPIASGHRELGA